MATTTQGRPGVPSLKLVVNGVTGARSHDDNDVVEDMLAGWARRQRAHGFKTRTIQQNQSVIRRFLSFTNEQPWTWTAALLDEWTVDLISTKNLTASTIRNYHGAVRAFEDYLLAPQYGWVDKCTDLFGTHPTRICFESNTVAHLLDYEGRFERRPLTKEELQQLFDFADSRVDEAVRQGRKGALAAYRDATLLKVIYAWGLRCTEACRLDVTDFHRHPHAPELGRYGTLEVRYGKASRGSPPKRRTVHTVMPWAVEAVDDYLVTARPLLGSGNVALWPTERGGRMQPRHVEARFAEYRDALGFPQHLVPHCLRHSHVTHQIEDGADARFVQEQVGHRYQSTTAIYTGVSGDFMNTMMRKALDVAFAKDGEPT